MISIIVVVHNDEKYLHICLNSILKQSFTDFEIICIDDNSSDQSFEILEYFAKKDSRIKIIKNKIYSGRGFCRNKCLEMAKGKYVLLLDGNEWISGKTLEVLFEKSEKNNLDVTIFKNMYFDRLSKQFMNNTNYEQFFLNNLESTTFNHYDFNEDFLFKIPYESTTKFYLKSFLDKNNIKFTNRFSKFEDIVFHYKIILSASKISFLNEPFHTKHVKDITSSNEELLLNTIQNSYLILNIFLKNNDIYFHYKKHLLNYIFSDLFEKFENINSDLKNKYFDKIIEVADNFYKDYGISEDMLKNIDSAIIKKLNLKDKQIEDYKNPNISVIIPVYNSEKFLNKCIDSVINQTFKNIEIICINDGSTDNSLNILRKYEKEFSFIKVISQKNKGVSAARNIGLENATGKYIYFLDSDDFLELNALNDIYRISEDENLDMVIFKLINYDYSTKKKYATDYFDMPYFKDVVYNDIFNYKILGRLVYRIPVTMQSSFFRFNLITDLRFIEGVIFEDNPFFVESLFNAKNIYFYDDYLCNKTNNESSITNSSFKNFSDCIYISNYMLQLAKKYNHYTEFRDILFFRKFNSILVRYGQIPDKYKEDFFNKIHIDFNDKKREYENDEVFQDMDEKFKILFYAGLNSKTYKEFESKINF